jgi:hypothetical protein
MTTLRLADRSRWRAARTLQDLADLTAAWLAGEIRSQPGYYGRVDVDEDRAPGLTAALVACNRAGFLTRTSQAGYVGPGYHGATRATVLAAVYGYTDRDTAQRLFSASVWAPTRVHVFIHPIGAGRLGEDAREVSWADDRATCSFGGCVPVGYLLDEFAGCSRHVIDALAHAWSVTVLDPEPGRNTLWAWLSEVMPALAKGARPVPIYGYRVPEYPDRCGCGGTLRPADRPIFAPDGGAHLILRCDRCGIQTPMDWTWRPGGDR